MCPAPIETLKTEEELGTMESAEVLSDTKEHGFDKDQLTDAFEESSERALNDGVQSAIVDVNSIGSVVDVAKVKSLEDSHDARKKFIQNSLLSTQNKESVGKYAKVSFHGDFSFDSRKENKKYRKFCTG